MINCLEDETLTVNDILFTKEYERYNFKNFDKLDIGDGLIKNILNNNTKNDKFYMITEMKLHLFKCNGFDDFKDKLRNNIEKYPSMDFEKIINI